MVHKSALFALQETMGGNMVDVAGWRMPMHYGSPVQEHQAVRQSAGMFDLTYMTIVDVKGNDARDYLRHLLSNDVARLQVSGKALYSCILNEQGGVIDDLIVYLLGTPKTSGEWYRLVLNCAPRKQDLEWMDEHRGRFDLSLIERPELAMIAVQGPESIAKVKSVLDAKRHALVTDLAFFQATQASDWFIARTGCTGEQGLEIMLPEEDAPDFWQALLDSGVTPCGLAARESLRLEAGINLYGAEMDESTSPLEANMDITIAWQPSDRNFVGRAALEAQRDEGVATKLVGLILKGEGELCAGQKVVAAGAGEGVITSAGFSPTLNCFIALARVPQATATSAQVDIKGTLTKVDVVAPGFL